MTIKENIGLLKSVLNCPRLVPGLSKMRLLSFCRAYGVSNLYVGIRRDDFVQEYVTDYKIKKESKKTIFYHQEATDDMYYYDLLGDNANCDRQDDDFLLVSEHVATNLEKLQDCFDRPKVKCIGGRKWKI